MTLEYEIKTFKKTIERRLQFIEIALSKINASIQSLEREHKQSKADIMEFHGADPKE